MIVSCILNLLSLPQVRSYAIETLSSAPDEELHLYLLQLVQALKYEEDVSGGTSGGDDVAGKTLRVSSLAAFLIERASGNIALANFLYWYVILVASDQISQLQLTYISFIHAGI